MMCHPLLLSGHFQRRPPRFSTTRAHDVERPRWTQGGRHCGGRSAGQAVEIETRRSAV